MNELGGGGGSRTRRRSRPACAWWREQESLARTDAAQTYRQQSNKISRWLQKKREAALTLHGDDVVDVSLEQPAVQAEARGVLEDDDFRDEGGQRLRARHIAALSLGSVSRWLLRGAARSLFLSTLNTMSRTIRWMSSMGAGGRKSRGAKKDGNRWIRNRCL
jgi:hypothetical protein